MSSESSAEYYRLINQASKRRLGGHHNVPSLMLTVNFGEIEAPQHRGAWGALGEQMACAASRLEAGGAECIVLCTNTMHRVAAAIEDAVGIPLLHIADATGAAVTTAGLSRLALLGTRFTMEEDFYRRRLEERYGVAVLVPSEPDRKIVHQVIYEELCHGRVRDASRDEYRRIIDGLAAEGAEGVILGCTEITLLIESRHSALPVFDTTRLHAEAAVDWALSAGC